MCKRYPILTYVFRLANKIFTKKELEEIDNEAQTQMLDAHKLSMKAPNPDPESIYDAILPNYATSKMIMALAEAIASEHADCQLLHY